MHWPVTSNPTGLRQPANFPYLLSTLLSTKLRSHNKLAILNEASGAVDSLLFTLSLHLGGRPQAASLVQGLRPRNAPYKTIAHRPCALIPAVPLHQRGCRQPNTPSDCPNGGRDRGLVKTGAVYGLVVTFPLTTDHCRYICCEISVSFAVMNSSSTGTPSSVFWMPRSIAGMI